MKWVTVIIMTLPLVVSAQTFNELWNDRGVPITSEPAPIIEQAKPIVEEQSEKPKLKDNNDECLTLRQARKKYRTRHLYWKDDHCWFARKGKR